MKQTALVSNPFVRKVKVFFIFACLAIFTLPAYSNIKTTYYPKVDATKKPQIVYQDKNTHIQFPIKIGGLSYVNVINYEKDYPGMGVSIEYKNEQITIDIYVYNLQLATITKQTIATELETAKRDIYTLERSANYKNVEQVKNQPPQITVGDLSFDYAMFIYLAAGKTGYSPVVAEFFLTSYKNNIVKLKITSFKENQQAAVDEFLLGLKSLLK